MAENRSWVLAARPEKALDIDDFELQSSAVPSVDDGQILVRNIYLSLDPTHRLWAREEDSYMPSVGLGQVMRSMNIGVVEQSRNDAYPVGAIVSGVFGWEDYSVSSCNGMDLLERVEMDPRIPISARFALFGHIGTAAYFGLKRVIGVKPGDVLVVTAAAGAVGSMAVQIGKILGCEVIGIAGSEEKCRWVSEELGADAVINYRTEPIAEALPRVCPNGVDAFLDQVGGAMLDAVLDNMAMNARIALSGFISQYENDENRRGGEKIYNLINQRARISGFVVLDFIADQEAWALGEKEISDWYLEGRLKYKLDVVDGFENVPDALGKLFDGSNTGKLLVKVSDEPEGTN